MLNMSSLTNLIALSVMFFSFFIVGREGELIWSTGVFALSGGITNWLAIHMLFEKVPGLYGSGVIPNRFEEFKAGIRSMIVNEFFSIEKLENFFKGGGEHAVFDPDSLDYDRLFNSFVEAVNESSLGSMLAMFGGPTVLDPLKEPIKLKIREMAVEMFSGNGSFLDSEKIKGKIEGIIDSRLGELSPQGVKLIVQDMIRSHLGWLVVWGGVFGGLIGFLVEFLGG